MNKKIGLKDIVLITLLTAIMIGIQTVVLMPFITNLKFVIWFVGGIDGVLCGIIYCLMIAKAPKLGTAFIFSFIFAVYYFFVNSMIIISAMIAGAGLVMELILWNNGYKNKIKATIAYTLFGLIIMLAPNVLIFLQKDAMIAGLQANGLTQEYIDSIFAVYSAENIGIGMLLTAIGSIAGTQIGYRVLNRYFISGGMVEK
ncbi:MptD family putative ECF transporter S component [Treponema denticola]|uniref:MptD family putative ECF transporter S component n=1 Tax=Treponema denticola TaxID=158 RepID=UPI0021049889|nr:MptD family putative ECF transporter S component [Treponema denticola]UTY24170.1 MptD family putative ECF transporter S component [Treponema denticola]